MSAILASLVKRLAEGGFGAGPAKAYWFAAGKKTWVAFAMSVVAGALFLSAQLGLCADCYGYGLWLVKASAVLTAIGLFDAAVRIEPPVQPPNMK